MRLNSRKRTALLRLCPIYIIQIHRKLIFRNLYVLVIEDTVYLFFTKGFHISKIIVLPIEVEILSLTQDVTFKIESSKVGQSHAGKHYEWPSFLCRLTHPLSTCTVLS